MVVGTSQGDSGRNLTEKEHFNNIHNVALIMSVSTEWGKKGGHMKNRKALNYRWILRDRETKKKK